MALVRLTRLTLEPLRKLGAAALDPAGLPNVRAIDLTELGITFRDLLCHRLMLTAQNLFNVSDHPDQAPIPEIGTLAHASFHLRLSDSGDTDFIQIDLPDRLTFGPHCDPQTLLPWLVQHGFESLENPS